MRNNIYKIFIIILASLAFISCKDDEGTDPGNDSNPVVTIYKYTVALPLSNDNDIDLRFAVNNKVEELYYLAELTADKQTQVNSLGEEGYMDYVISNGIKVSDVSTSAEMDAVVTNMQGDYTITAVAVGHGKKSSSQITFTGIVWTDLATGTYTFYDSSITGQTTTTTTLQMAGSSETYRFKDLFGSGYHLEINLLSNTGTNATGEYTFFRVPQNQTPFVVDQKTVYVRDYGYWKGSDDPILTGGFESGIYADYACFLQVQYYTSANSLGNGTDTFVPN